MLFFILVGFLVLSLPFLIGPARHWILNLLISSLIFLSYCLIIFAEFPHFIADELEYAFPNYGRVFFGVVVFGCIIMTVICLLIERNLQEHKSGFFYDDRLFNQYGIRIKADVLPVGVKRVGHSADELARNLYFHLSTNVKKQFGEGANISTEIISVVDRHLTSDKRIFLKVKLVTRRSSQITNFVNLITVGQQLSINSQTYLKGDYAWHEALFFIATAPTHYWFWIYHWMTRNEFVQNRIGSRMANSFEKMDMDAYLKSVNFTIMMGIEDFAKENQLMTEELKQMIIRNVNNIQSINIKRSRGVRIAGVRFKNKAA